MVIPCDKTEDIKQLKEDIKVVKDKVYETHILLVEIRKDVALHSKLWGAVSGFFISIAAYVLQKKF